MRILILLLPLLLGACSNLVRSETPWFVSDAAADMPPLREGVWVAAKPDCSFDADLLLEHWPDCAEGWVVRDGEILTLLSFTGEPGSDRGHRADYDWSHTAYALADGTPRIFQMHCGAPTSLPVPADVPPPPRTSLDETVSRLVYCYWGLHSKRLDDEGRIVAFSTWPIWCGPLPDRPEAEGSPSGTDAPFAGITIVGDHCIADDVEALRNAAVASESLGPSSQLRWVRDGWR